MADSILECSLETKIETISRNYEYLVMPHLGTIQKILTGVLNPSQTKLGSWFEVYKVFFWAAKPSPTC